LKIHFALRRLAHGRLKLLPSGKSPCLPKSKKFKFGRQQRLSLADGAVTQTYRQVQETFSFVLRQWKELEKFWQETTA